MAKKKKVDEPQEAPLNQLHYFATPIYITKQPQFLETVKAIAADSIKQVHGKAKPNKIIRRTYNVGKDKFRPVVGVLLPNRTIRNNVANKAFKFEHTPVEEIRKFLLRNGFIKVGSTSPNDVLYKMYESIMLIDGEVKNHNPDNLLYNFFNDKTP